MELGIDLQYLLFLQNLRLATGGIFEIGNRRYF